MKTQIKRNPRPGRPKAVIDWKKVGRYLQAQCSATGIAGILGISVDTFYTRCKKDNNIDFTVFSEQKKAEGKELLRAQLFNQAMDGNVTMGIWLSKQYLGFKDQVEQTIQIPELKVQPMNPEEQERINKSIEMLNESNPGLQEKS